jgi:hypothetical protein
VCPPATDAGLRVAVADDAGAPLCDATVTARDGSYSEQLFAYDCVYTGALERTGTYTVSAAQGERRTDVQAVKVTGGPCTVRTTDLKVLLPD